MKGYNGKILRVNLTTGKCTSEEPPEDFFSRYIGGRGFVIHTLLKEVPKGADPFGPENKLVFALGAITGYPLPGSGRNSVGAKSPLTGGYGEAEAGGYWGAALKKAGYDAVIVEGISAKPVYLFIDDGEATIHDATGLWGLEIADTEKAIREELGDNKIRTATIGPSGEKLIRYAIIANDVSHVAGRTGMGAVMGSKKLKAIAVRGGHLPEMADPKKITELARWMATHFKEKSRSWEYGTGRDIVQYEATGNLPIRNFRGGRFPGIEKIKPQVMFEKSYIEKMGSCYSCPVRCKRVVKLGEPWNVNPIYGGPEYETIAALGSNCGIDDLEALIKADEICSRYGIDTISTGVSISFAMECFEEGILTPEDTGGLELTFGNAKAFLAMVERIALRQGLGDLLAEGTKRASERIGKGSDAFAMHVKGLELGMHEPRYKQGMGLHYSTHATGADHCTGIQDDQYSKKQSDGSEPIPSTELSSRKAALLYRAGLWKQLVNSVGVCMLVPWSSKQIQEIMVNLTGWPVDDRQLTMAAERGMTLARIFNIREGFTAADDKLPRRFATSPADGPLQGVAVDPEKLAQAQQDYYQMLGWDASGVPTCKRLAELGIEWAAEYLG
jgi:aldehyde:ferredoxin oxidoreductase